MIPILYSSMVGAPITTGMGMGPLSDCIECTCFEQINGEFECSFKYPYIGSLYPYIKKGAIVAAKPSPAYGNTYQHFKIYKISKPINGIITVNAHHISYELSGLPVGPFNFEDATPHVIMNELYNTSLISDERFVFHSDLTKKINIFSSIPKNLREVMLGTDNSIASASKNEFLFNNYSVSLLEARGQATEVEIIYGRELTDYNQEESIENAYSHIVAYAITKNTNGEDMIVGTSPGAIQLIDPVSLGHQKCLIRDFTSDFENSEDITQSNLTEKVEEYIEKNKLSEPAINFRISFVDLKKIPEYRHIIAAFGNIGLGDNIKVLIQKLGITAKARIIATTYNVLAEEFISVDVGTRRENVADTIYKLQKNSKTVAHSVVSLTEGNKFFSGHQHDDRYPTKLEVITAIVNSIDELETWVVDSLASKSETDHTHDDRYNTKAEIVSMMLDTVVGIKDLLAEKSDIGHTHDDLYCTETETENLISESEQRSQIMISDLASQTEIKLSEKSDKDHSHDDDYCSKAQLSALVSDIKTEVTEEAQELVVNLEAQTEEKLSGKSNVGHSHNDLYYTEAETENLISEAESRSQILVSDLSAQIDTKLSVKSNKNHTHDDVYCSKAETAALISDAKTEVLVDTQGLVINLEAQTEEKLSGKSNTGHTHDDRYYTDGEVDALLSDKSDTSHTHDGRYYTETEVDTKLSGKSDTNHTHDDRYYTESETNTLLANKSDTNHDHTALFHGDYNLYLVAGSTCTIRPNNADVYSYYLGSGTHRFANIYTKNLNNSGSDRNLKENIKSIPQRYINMLDGIEPVVYKWKNGDRIHAGYISQEVEASMKNNKITAEEFGGFCKDAKLDEKGNPVDGEYVYSLRYGEFIPILHAKIKQLEDRYDAIIAEYDIKISELNKKINDLLSH